MIADDPIPAWLATYLVHSTILLVAAAGLVSRRLGLPPGWRESLWRAAVLGGLVTATAQVVFAPSPWSIALPGRTSTPPVAESPGRPAPPGVSPAPGEPIPAPAFPDGAASSAPPAPAVSPRSTTPVPTRLLDVVLLVAAGFSGLAAVRLARARGTLRRRLSRRRDLADGPWRAALDALTRRAGLRRRVRLSAVPGLGSPLARGVLRAEICVPERAVAELAPPERDALLAHELAHVLRRDALRLACHRTIETLLAIQPLNRLAGRRLRECAEFRCDRLAAAWTGRPRILAACLTRVASWVMESRTTAWLPAMASRGRLLDRRIDRLTGDDTGRHGRGLAGVAALAALVVLGVLAPPVTTVARPAPTAADVGTPVSDDLAGDLRALASEMEALRDALSTLRADPALRTRIERLDARWDRLRRRAATAESLTEESE
jgi:beta-lactamase regulating signal transducer with metallopeptidase domain